MEIKNELVLIGCGLGVLLAAGWIIKGNVSAEDVGAGVVSTVGNVAGGAIQEAGTWFGIPKTNQTACEKAIADGDVWRQIWDCPASKALGNWF